MEGLEREVGESEAEKNEKTTKPTNLLSTLVNVVMPDEGIHDENGFLFHHTTLGYLKLDHILRLSEYGIKYQDSVRFTPEEDERIRKNWKKFAKKHDFRYEDGGYYGDHWVRSRKKDGNIYYQEQLMLMKLNMYPSICKYLEHRSAAQVSSRMTRIFDPHHIGIPSPFSDEEILLVYTLKSRNVPVVEIANQLKRPVQRVHAMIRDKRNEFARLGLKPEEVIQNPELLKHRVIRTDQRRRFFVAVLKKLGLSIGAFTAELIRSSSLDSVYADSKNICFTDLIPSFGAFNEKNLKKSWKVICQQLVASYRKALEMYSDDTGLAWNAACNEVMPIFDKSIENYIIFLTTLRKCVDKDAQIVRLKYINQRKLAKKLYKKGVINDIESFSLNEYFGYEKLKEMITKKSKFFFTILELQLNVRDKLQIFINCFKKLRFQGADSLRFPPISRYLFVESAIEVIRSLDENWYPPKCLQPWVRSPELVDLFRRSSYTSTLSNALRDIIAFRQMSLTDEKKLLNLSKSGGVASAIPRLIPTRVEGNASSQIKPTLQRPRKRGWQETAVDALGKLHTFTAQISRPSQLSFCDSPDPVLSQQRVDPNPKIVSSFTIDDRNQSTPMETGSVDSYRDDNVSEIESAAEETGLIHIPKYVERKISPELEMTGWDFTL